VRAVDCSIFPFPNLIPRYRTFLGIVWNRMSTDFVCLTAIVRTTPTAAVLARATDFVLIYYINLAIVERVHQTGVLFSVYSVVHRTRTISDYIVTDRPLLMSTKRRCRNFGRDGRGSRVSVIFFLSFVFEPIVFEHVAVRFFSSFTSCLFAFFSVWIPKSSCFAFTFNCATVVLCYILVARLRSVAPFTLWSPFHRNINYYLMVSFSILTFLFHSSFVVIRRS